MTEKTLNTTKQETRDRFTGSYTEEQLRAAFDKVADADDYRGPIEATIHSEEFDLVREAVSFFTATQTSFSTIGRDAVLVTSEGYRAGPAGDH